MAIAWRRAQHHQDKIVVAGNHDRLLDASQDHGTDTLAERAQLDWGDIIYLENSEVESICNGRQLRVSGSL